jgi:hypothetical protein
MWIWEDNNRGAKGMNIRNASAVLSLVLLGACLGAPQSAQADEDGVSYWLPGTFGNLAAAPQPPGFQFGVVNYNTWVSASGDVARAREIRIGDLDRSATVDLNVKLKSDAYLFLLNPTYVVPKSVLGGQFAIGMTAIVGTMSSSLAGTLTVNANGAAATRQGRIDSTVAGFSDLYPMATLRWPKGNNNFMVYLTGDIPVGTYDPRRLSNLGIGHGAIDGGVGYTYLNEKTGREFSAVTGLTGNFENTDTNYTNGLDWHLGWSASQFLSQQWFVGVTGYFYHQVTADHGQPAFLGANESHVAAAGPQIGYLFPLGKAKGFLGLKGYAEFNSYRRASGGNVWLTFAVTP